MCIFGLCPGMVVFRLVLAGRLVRFRQIGGIMGYFRQFGAVGFCEGQSQNIDGQSLLFLRDT